MWKIQLLLLNQASIFDGWIPQLKAKLTEIAGKNSEPVETGWAMVPPPSSKNIFSGTHPSSPHPILPFYFQESERERKQRETFCPSHIFRPSAGSENDLAHKKVGANFILIRIRLSKSRLIFFSNLK